MRPYLLERRCPVQKMVCTVIPTCPQGAVSYVEDEAEPLGGRIEFDYERCDGCGQCAIACCGKAIEMR